MLATRDHHFFDTVLPRYHLSSPRHKRCDNHKVAFVRNHFKLRSIFDLLVARVFFFS